SGSVVVRIRGHRCGRDKGETFMTGEAIRVILTGICTFVGGDIGHNHRPTTAVFANATHHHPEHHVSLIISDDDYVVDTDASDVVLYSELGKAFHVILLDGKSIAIEGLVGHDLEFARPAL